MQYLILTSMFALLGLGIRQQYLAYRLRIYMKQEYPEKLEEFFNHTFTGTFRMNRWLQKHDYTGDRELASLRKKMRNANAITALSVLLIPLILLFVWLISIQYKG